MLQTLLDLFFPKVSLNGQHGSWVTDIEWKKLRAYTRQMNKADLRAAGIFYLDTLVAAARYDDSPLLQTALKRFKYGGVRDLSKQLGLLLSSASRLLALDTILVPVPLYWNRNFKRGFNQSLLLAEEVEKETARPLMHCLKRIRSTGQQAKRNRAERIAAMKDAFVVTSDILPDHIILIDDVATTGATLDACAEVLKRAGVRRVDALVVALG